MGRAPSITPEQGEALIEAYGRHGTVLGAAQEVGVQEQAAYRFFRKLSKTAAPHLAHERRLIEKVIDTGGNLWDTRRALDGNYSRILGLVAKLEAGIVEEDGEYTTQTPIAIHVAALREVREHIKTSMQLLKLLVDVEEVRRFQDLVLRAIGEADEPTRQRIIASLQDARALGLAPYQS